MPSLGYNPCVPQPRDVPTVVPLAPEADLSVLDHAKIFHILKGGCAPLPAPSDWDIEGGPMLPRRSVKLLQCGAGLDRSPQIGFRCAVDL
jgi:hypothetical protein